VVRRIIPIIILLVLSAGYVGASFAQDGERGTAWYLRGSFGAASQDLSELESALSAEKDALKNLGVDFSTYSNSFGNIWDYRVEVGAIITRGLSLGFMFDYQPARDRSFDGRHRAPGSDPDVGEHQSQLLRFSGIA
jgi:hypothetical protein